MEQRIFESRVKKDFSGIACIGDVHGDLEAFHAHVDQARAENRFIVQLGDLIDRGSDSPGCLRLMLNILDAGDGMFVRGNHDDKLYRLLLGHDVRVDQYGLASTVEQLTSAPDVLGLINAFMRAYEEAPYWARIGDHAFVHGAFHPSMLRHRSPKAADSGKEAKCLRYLALFGEASGEFKENGLPVRSYDWLDRIPSEMTVVVGHDVQSKEAAFEKIGRKGGRVLFADTGSGKGGVLSTVRVDFS